MVSLGRLRGRFCVRFGCTDDGSECLGLIDEIDIIRIEREKKEEEERLAAEAAAAAEVLLLTFI